MDKIMSVRERQSLEETRRRKMNCKVLGESRMSIGRERAFIGQPLNHFFKRAEVHTVSQTPKIRKFLISIQGRTRVWFMAPILIRGRYF